MLLNGRTCIITGASGGFGKRLAARFWREGASLLLTGRDAGVLESIAASLPTAETQKLVLFAGDLGDRQTSSRLISKAKESFAALTVLINNAAVQGPIGPLWENNPSDWEEALRINLAIPAHLSVLALPWMLSNSYGKIINISGGGATASRPRFSAYAAAKAGLVRLTETLAEELTSTGVDVNAIAPGAMPTKMSQQILAAGPDAAGSLEFKRVQDQPQQHGDGPFHRAVDLATFLASAASDGITGRLISALWDRWENLPQRKAALQSSDVYTLRRIVAKDRGLDWDDR